MSDARSELEDLGGSIQFFVQSCLCLAQNPGDLPGVRMLWRNEDAAFLALMTGALVQACSAAWARGPWVASLLGVDRGHDEVVLRLTCRTENPLEVPGLDILRRYATDVEVAGNSTGKSVLRLRFTSTTLATALADTIRVGCPPNAAGPRFEKP